MSHIQRYGLYTLIFWPCEVLPGSPRICMNVLNIFVLDENVLLPLSLAVSVEEELFLVNPLLFEIILGQQP